MTAERFLARKTGAWKNTFAHLKEGPGGWFILSFLENLQCFPASAGQSDQSGHCTESFSWLITVGFKDFALHFISFYPSPHSAVENSLNLMKIQRKMKNDYVSMLLTVSRTTGLLGGLFLILLCYTGRHRQKLQLFQDRLFLWMCAKITSALCDVTASGSAPGMKNKGVKVANTGDLWSSVWASVRSPVCCCWRWNRCSVHLNFLFICNLFTCNRR